MWYAISACERREGHYLATGRDGGALNLSPHAGRAGSDRWCWAGRAADRRGAEVQGLYRRSHHDWRRTPAALRPPTADEEVHDGRTRRHVAAAGYGRARGRPPAGRGGDRPARRSAVHRPGRVRVRRAGGDDRGGTGPAARPRTTAGPAHARPG